MRSLWICCLAVLLSLLLGALAAFALARFQWFRQRGLQGRLYDFLPECESSGLRLAT
jgi:ABC-type spermidine/putrescine transport system permease subunit II